MVHQKRYSSVKFIDVAIHIVKQNKTEVHFVIYQTLAFLCHAITGCLNGLILFEAFSSVFRRQLLHFRKKLSELTHPQIPVCLEYWPLRG